jgi:hypothetical protein
MTRDIAGQRYGELVAVEPAGRNAHGSQLWLYKCDCGNNVVRPAHTITGKRLHSCGCKVGSWMKGRRPAIYKHGMSLGKGCKNGHPIYYVWASMRQRCYDPNYRRYQDWGGRGIRVCDEWKDSKAFIDWAFANGWQKGLHLDRIDNDGNYEPANCHFATPSENSRNTRRAAKYKDRQNERA